MAWIWISQDVFVLLKISGLPACSAVAAGATRHLGRRKRF